MAKEEHVIESIFNHDKKGENWTYLIRCYGRDSSEDSQEPLSTLSRNKVVSYHKQESLRFQDNFDEYING